MTSSFKLVQRVSKMAVVLALAGGACPAWASDKIVEGAARVVRIQGSARYSTDQTTWKELKKGTVLKGAVLIQTAPKAYVDVCLREGKAVESLHDEVKENSANVIRVFENTALGIDKLMKQKTSEGTVEEVQLDLRAGEMMGTVGKLLDASKYEIKVPKGVIGVRGGTFMVSSAAVLNVLTGSAIIVMVNTDGSMTTRKVMPRQGFDPTTGMVTQLTLEMSPQPLTCEESTKPTGPAAPITGIPHGTGMGGSLRRF